ncbi:MAG: 30S ribosomal protein S12 methylthiotransferase RimO [candidate division Zixibacteria bacterium]|nr:30S ribosomal protein S12 methylthiotransferase RimO [candidate division Zixibacteria bacterium]
MKTFYIHKLGCPKNDVDADYIAGYLIKKKLAQVDSPEKADILIVNSCGFIQPAKEESIGAALALAEVKENYPGKKLIMTGCLSQRYSNELAADIPELDGVLGLDNITDIDSLLEGKKESVVSKNQDLIKYREYDFNRAVDDSEVFAYLKISDGCDNRCAYCAIPDIRGQFRSRTLETIVDEARYLLDNGKKELILVSQESSAYGRDIYGKRRITDLLDSLSELPGDFWLRIMYLHPARLTKELIDYMIDNERICNYFDLPLQHINDELLFSMGRQVNRKSIEDLIAYIRSRSQRSVIRTNFILGYPGETKEMFEELCEFIEEYKFDRLGAFVFSPEEGTRAAGLPDQVDEMIREKRFHKVMEIQRDIAFDKNEDDVNQSFDVIVDTIEKKNNQAIARSRFDAPEIDQIIRLDSADIYPGDIINIKITGYDGYDLFGAREEL